MSLRTMLIAALVVAAMSMPTWGAAKEQKVTITLNEFSFAPAKVALTAGVKAEIRLVNKGKVEHEFMVYTTPKAGTAVMALHEWAEETSYFKGLEVKVEGGGIEVKGKDIYEVEVAAGKSAEVIFTPKKKGMFEIGCLIEGHYEAGMKGVLTVK